MLQEIFNTFNSIEKLSNYIEEDLGYLTFKGLYKDSSDLSILKVLESNLTYLNINNSITFQIDSSIYKSVNAFLDEIYDDCSWKMTLNKTEYLKNLGYTFFYSSDNFIKWSARIFAFDVNSIFNTFKNIKIIVNGINESFGGPNILVCNQISNEEFNKSDSNLPDQLVIKKIVHTTINEEIQINPLNHLITYGSYNKYSSSFFERSIVSLVSCLCNEIDGKNSIILRGVRRLDLTLFDEKNKSVIEIKHLKLILDAVTWVYEERIEIRLKLLLDRITLDIDIKTPYINGLISVIESSLQQAKERYNFIIYDRQDDYHKELRELLKDLKNITELYSLKIRSVLNNLLRDILATLVLIGFTLFTKITEIKLLSENKILSPIFKIFAIYFLFSIIFQSITDWYDLNKTRKEFIYWKGISREYITQSDFDNHMKRTVIKRKNGTIIFYSILALIYLLISILCWNFKTIFQCLLG